MRRISVLLFSIVLVLTGCASRPRTFFQSSEPGWISIEIRKDFNYDQAWDTVTDILAHKFDLETLNKDGGYIRTDWIHTWTGKLTPDYRVRIIVKFTDNKSKVDLKADAEFKDGELWLTGTDTQLTSTIKTDIMGAVSRTTK